MNENDDNNNDVAFDEEIAYIPPQKIATDNIQTNINQKIKMEKKMAEDLNLKGVENIKKVSAAITALVNAGIQSYSDDGKITLGDFGHFIKIVPEILLGIPAFGGIKEEITDRITDSEMAEIKMAILNNLEIRNELDKEFVAEIIDTLYLILKMVTNRKARKAEIGSD